MRSNPLAVALLAAAAVTALAPVAGHAAASGSVVFDPTNLIQNTTTALNSVRQVAAEYKQLEAQYQQYTTMLKQLKTMDGAAAVALGTLDIPSLAEISRAVRAYEQLGRSIEQTKGVYTQRLDEARLMGVSWAQYVASERKRIASNQAGAAARVQTEVKAFERVEDDYKFARETAEKIPMTEGVHAAQQQTNAILNRMLTQNAEILRTLAQANGSQKAEEMMQKDMKEAAARAAAERVLNAQRNVAIDPASAVDAMTRAAGSSVAPPAKPGNK